MKKLYTIVIVLFSALGLALLSNSCTEMPEVIEELNLANVLTPTSNSATISIADGRTTTFTWSGASTATQFILEIYQWDTASAPKEVTVDEDGNVQGGSLYKTFTVEETTLTYQLDADYTYYARVKGQNHGEDGRELQGDSHWSAFRYPIEPYLVMDAVPTFEVTDRTSTTITVAWTVASGDSDGINQIRVSPDPDDADSSYKAYTTSGTECTVTGLSPLTQYTLTANFGSAVRGTICAWTRPDDTGFTTVSDSASFIQALIDAGSTLKLKLAYSEEPYDIGTLPVLGDLEIIGEETASGDKPVVNGYFNLYPQGTYTLTIDGVDHTLTSAGASSLKVSGLSLNGDNYAYSNAITCYSDFANASVSVEVVNTDFDDYKAGIIYDNSKNVNYSSIVFDGIKMSGMSGAGGDCIDFRTSNISSITLKNSTFTDGCRTFLRFALGTSNTEAQLNIGDVIITNNTFNNLCNYNDTNNKGLFRINPSSFTGKYILTGNLFLNTNALANYDVLIWSDCMAPIDVSEYEVGKNFFYNNAANFLYDNVEAKTGNGHKSFGETEATKNGGAMLDDDPCYDSSRSNFYVTSADVINAGAGDPRWLADYIPEPAEELTVVEYGTTWDCTDSKTLYSKADETVVHGNLKFIVDSNPIEVSDAGIYFTAKSTLMTYSGMPTDCALAFLVDGPGSVVVSTNGSWNTQLEVSYAPYDASTGLISSNTTTVGGAVSSGVEDEYISLVDIPEDGSTVYIVYLYVSSPMYLTGLSWVNDFAGGVDMSLSTPENLKLNPDTVKEGSTENSTLSWDAVTGADTYTIYCNDEVLALGIPTTSYAIITSGLAVGSYSYSVQAIAAAGSTRTDSAISESVTLTVESNWTTVPTDAVTEWSFDTWENCNTLYGDQLTDDTVYADGYLNFLNGGGSGFKFATTNYSEEDGAQYRVQLAGSGNATKCCLQFMATTSGTLKISTISSGTTTRYLQAYVDGTATGDTMLAESTGDATYPSEREVDLTISGQSTISIASTSGGINIFWVKWIPTGVTE